MRGHSAASGLNLEFGGLSRQDCPPWIQKRHTLMSRPGSRCKLPIFHGVERRLNDWEFTPAARPEHQSVTFLYRARTVLPAQPYEFDVQTRCCALPTHIVDPGYPVNSIGEGSVILQVRINTGGAGGKSGGGGPAAP